MMAAALAVHVGSPNLFPLRHPLWWSQAVCARPPIQSVSHHIYSLLIINALVEVEVGVAPELVGQVVGVARLEPAEAGAEKAAGELLHHGSCVFEKICMCVDIQVP